MWITAPASTDWCHGSWVDVFVLGLVCCVLIFCPFCVSLQCSPLCSSLHVLSSASSPSSSHVCLPLSVSIVSLMLSPLSFPRYLTCPPPSSLSSPVPRPLISVSVYLNFCSPCTLCQFVVGVWLTSPSSPWCFPFCVSSLFFFSRFDLNFAFLCFLF